MTTSTRRVEPAWPEGVAAGSVQALVDALSAAMGRSVLLDDIGLTPVAYSRQWEIDAVRSECILGRGATPEVRDALLAQGIEVARDVVRTTPEPSLEMVARICMPVWDRAGLLGYIWMLDPEENLAPWQLEQLRYAAGNIARLWHGAVRPVGEDEAELVAALRSPDPRRRWHAADRVLERRLLPAGSVIACLLSGSSPGRALNEARRATRIFSVGHALAATSPEGAALLVAADDQVLMTLTAEDVAGRLGDAIGRGIFIGQSPPTSVDRLDQAFRRAAVSLRVARSRRGDTAVAWSTLGADRLVAQLAPTALADVPARLGEFLRSEPTLTETLEVFLDTGGDVKATAARLHLHRSGLYYRLGQIERSTDLDLDRGDDRLLAHLAIRATRLDDGGWSER